MKPASGQRLFLIDPIFTGHAGGGLAFNGGMHEGLSGHDIGLSVICDRDAAKSTGLEFDILPVLDVKDDLQSLRYQPPGTDISNLKTRWIDSLNALLPQVGPDDILWDYYLLGPLQLDIYVSWLESLAPDQRPCVMAGVDVYFENWMHWILGLQARIQALSPWLRITSTSFINAGNIQQLHKIRAHWIPRPLMHRAGRETGLDRDVVEMLGLKTPERAPVIGFFTDATMMKSFHLFGDSISWLLKKTKMTFVIQVRNRNLEKACMDSLATLDSLQQEYPDRLFLPEGLLEDNAYKTMVELCDGMLITYDPASHFSATPSGTMIECFAAGVVPITLAGSSMAKEMELFGIDIPVIENQNVDDFRFFLRDFAKDHKNWLSRNSQAISKWKNFQSYDNFLSHLLTEAWR